MPLHNTRLATRMTVIRTQSNLIYFILIQCKHYDLRSVTNWLMYLNFLSAQKIFNSDLFSVMFQVTYVDMDVRSPFIVIPEYGDMEK